MPSHRMYQGICVRTATCGAVMPKRCRSFHRIVVFTGDLPSLGCPCREAQTKKPPAGGSSWPWRLPFRVLLAAPRLVQPDLLALDLARIARDEAGGFQRRLQAGIIFDQRARDAVPNRAGLAVFSAAIDIDGDVEARK